MRSGLYDILSSRTNAKARAMVLWASSLLFGLIGKGWGVYQEGGERGKFVLILASITAVELQIALLTDIPEPYLPDVTQAAKIEAKSEKERKRRERENKYTTMLEDEKIPTNPNLSTANSNSNPETVLDAEEVEIFASKSGLGPWDVAVLTLELMESYLLYLCEENLTVPIVTSVFTQKESSWENLPVKTLLSLRRALSDAFRCVFQFFEDCKLLGIRLGGCEVSLKGVDTKALSGKTDHVLTRGIRCLATWLRLETTEHKNKFIDVLPYLLTLRPPKGSKTPDVIGYLAPGILEHLGDKKVAKTLRENRAIATFTDLIAQKISVQGIEPREMNYVEVSQLCQPVIELITEDKNNYSPYILKEVSPYLPSISKALTSSLSSKSDLKLNLRELSDMMVSEARMQASLLVTILTLHSARQITPNDLARTMAGTQGSLSRGGVRVEKMWKAIVNILAPEKKMAAAPQDCSLVARGIDALNLCVSVHPSLARVLAQENNRTALQLQHKLWKFLMSRDSKDKLSDQLDEVVTSFEGLLARLRNISS
uniref:Uncharacterized protein n=1 Tax=Amorphochlora amoebiformis TaxID=1561963 RepID=A0A7S0H4W1_9EUKA|mmetsp:Transcript_34496/g.55568  ORF Transcript_34496/g.55568 Transcript_34496/m.55568 type:complete len:541 (+) Transcript_34496:741-2363(+)